MVPDYTALVQRALLAVVEEAVSKLPPEGSPSQRAIYLTFRTDALGVELSARVREQYPEELTVVLQHQYWGLVVEEGTIQVTLQFGGLSERVAIPLDSLTSFADPAAEFGLRLVSEHAGSDEEEVDTETGTNDAAGSGQVVSLDEFRRD